ncbi:ECF RNA polymerase sigma factor SigK [Pseudactinotalea suaedae]|uniref:ECF RNA polymerase sigma factor SigK n=1 Tax=Pseudactinotalea suaedae TaxID=1524924 RepID=UPI0012E2A033|nr:ECF RNA polymerase sigma factor SigK [Pseudactinotalea suaedae]
MAPRSTSAPGEREPLGADAAPDHDPTARLIFLMRRSARGDEQAFAELYDLTSSRLYGLVIRVVRDPAQAAEVTQDCYLQIWQNAARFDPDRGSVLGWMLTLAHRRAVDRVRSAQSTVERDRRYAVQELQEVPDVSEAVVDRLEAERVRKALGGLTTMQREAIELAYYGGYTHTEVAGLLDIPLGTAKTRVRDGLIRLRDFFEGDRR